MTRKAPPASYKTIVVRLLGSQDEWRPIKEKDLKFWALDRFVLSYAFKHRLTGVPITRKEAVRSFRHAYPEWRKFAIERRRERYNLASPFTQS